MRGKPLYVVLTLAVAIAAFGQRPSERRDPKPGFNLFSVEDDIRVGAAAKVEIQKQMQVVDDREINAHEIAHVALRHGTNQASKANLIQLPAMLASGRAGHSMLGRLAQFGIGLGAGLMGTRIMAGAGYSPVELAGFFEKLEADGGRGGLVAQFFSDHPNSANRKRAIVAAKLPEPSKPQPAKAQPGGGSPPEIRPAARLREYQGREFTTSYPEDWEVLDGQRPPGVTIAPREGLVRGSGGSVAVGDEDLVRELSGTNSGSLRLSN